MIYNICAYLYKNLYLIAKRIKFNLGFEPIRNAPNLHIKLKGNW
jgi:hypothetical protein